MSEKTETRKKSRRKGTQCKTTSCPSSSASNQNDTVSPSTSSSAERDLSSSSATLPPLIPASKTTATALSPKEEPRYQDLLSDPALHRTLYEMFADQLRAHQMSNDNVQHTRNLRSSDTGKEPSVPVPKSDKESKASSSNKATDNVPSSSSDLDGERQRGLALADSLFKRFEVAKKSHLKKNKNNKLAQYDSSDDEFLGLDDDDDDQLNKICVPDYDLKVKLYKAHYSVIEKMKPKQVAKLCKEILPQLDEIMKGTTYSKRHEVFKTCGFNRDELNRLTVAKPFTSCQDHRVMSLIEKKVSAEHDLTANNGELMYYIGFVLIPEALVRIFALANKIDLELAENELLYKGGYDGTVNPDLLLALDSAESNEQQMETNEEEEDNRQRRTGRVRERVDYTEY